MVSNVSGVSGFDTTINNESNTLGRDTFLKLLVAQLQHQDPLSPLENTEFTAQMAQFSSLEELYNINDNLKNLELYEASINNAQAVSFIGKEVEAIGNTIQIRNETPDDLRYDLMGDAAAVYIDIYDSDGYPVRQVEKGSQSSGSYSESWDGRDDDGNTLPDGTYSYTVSAGGPEGSAVIVNSYVTGKVTEVVFNDGNVSLMVGGQGVGISDVIKIKETSE